MKNITDHVFVFTSVVQQLNSIVIIDDDYLVVVDPGFFPGEIAALRSFLKPYEIPSRSRLLILTHSHFDHIAGVPYFPEYAVVTSSAWDRDNEERAIRQLEHFDTEFYVDRPWEQGSLPFAKIHYPVHHHETVGPFQFFHTPGHTLDSMSFTYKNVLFVGDYLSSLEFPFINASLPDYKHSLQVITELVQQSSITTLMSQHGPPADGTEISARIDSAHGYIDDLCHLVETAKQQHDAWSDVLAQANSLFYQGRPIPLGLKSAHERNLKTIWEEYHQSLHPSSFPKS
ncbi:Glyoxylase, beta-lactamase superfamily II [Sulfobacillus thermosulfidooxidans DSM 9293]|uniref:Glyoxylase, beta-lactamase superfamily II n=1 Tax=Sulfobacillus thermosulfidooxidans (strain DSM 9293 / VKM B-1269 / AT-1) TaxID=929705 RepID=A0A1W1WIY7_SULTA|nr:MBL fold metallo-hydrolase [Sulfobacillus thermosulfidooxidans]SMC05703.1 Glyoxylase, beta-lactamase superfamily II [Sulfobacillus thermosulfidooxidans DSM 9293]